MKKLKYLTEQNFTFPYIYIGEVINNNDPKKRDRVQVRIFGLIENQKEYPWAEQSGVIFSGNKSTVGFSTVPDVNSLVYIQFLHGNPSKPVYTGIARGADDSSDLHKLSLTGTIYDIRNNNIIGPELGPLNNKSKYPYNNVIETNSGNIIEMDDTEGNERIAIEHKIGSYIEIRPDGTVQIKSIKDFYNIVKGIVQEYIEGDKNLTVKGNLNETIEGNKNTSVNGKENKNITNSYTVSASNIYLN